MGLHIDNMVIKEEEWEASGLVVYREGTCDCGEEMALYDDINECERCGQLWNGFGQRLRPMDEWEEPWDDDY